LPARQTLLATISLLIGRKTGGQIERPRFL
jgi:hypothetical protein